ncbi:hypothetical protein NP233_g12362 [Leucocoprinus birnbaumii]|uniref:Uncharacterized protein n=1 Tax=Leucocoprinus birnbaumii TaxID=56174 RepID=A0AAD5VKA2_9AGAR|nr:hypothetical protein NP233_g12362 [Leucocoprinus birnbaumii]
MFKYLYILFSVVFAASILYAACKARGLHPDGFLSRSYGLEKSHASIYLNVILAVTVIFLLVSDFSTREQAQSNRGIVGIAVAVNNARKTFVAQEPAEDNVSIDRKVQCFEVPKFWNENKTTSGNEFPMSDDGSATLFNDRFSEFDAMSEGKGSNTSNKGGQGGSDSVRLKILSTTQFTTSGCTADVENRITVSRS